MIIPNKNRFDYGSNLQPPQGFEFDSAFATSYSLDLNAILAIPVALCFKDTLEGDLKGEKIALYEALSQLKGKLKIFYQQGNIHLPREFNRLFALLEPFLSPIVPRKEANLFCSFHPKLWILKFRCAEDSKIIKYRLIVLTRNLTFDRSWDLAAAIDGDKMDEEQQVHPNLVPFINSLLPYANEVSFIESMINEIPYIRWYSPNGFYNLRMLPGGGAHIEKKENRFGRPLDFSSKVDDMLVVSPFVDSKALAWLAKKSYGSKFLFSRSEELDSLGKESLKDWECFSINEEVVDGEEKLEHQNAVLQNLHAKLIVSRHGKTSHWHLGSANASSPALGNDDSDEPRNTEFMLRLTGRDDTVGVNIIFNQLFSEDDSGLFVKHEFEEIDKEKDEVDKQLVRRLKHDLISLDWTAEANLQTDGKYTYIVRTSDEIIVPSVLKVSVGLFYSMEFFQIFNRTLTWKDIELMHISSLIPINIETHDDEVLERLVIKSSLLIEGGDFREELVLRQLINSKDKFLNYIRLLLQHEPDKEKWLAMGSQMTNGQGIGGINWEMPIFEQLMISASRYPDQLKRIDQLLKKLEHLDTVVPADFLELWDQFSVFVEGRV